MILSIQKALESYKAAQLRHGRRGAVSVERKRASRPASAHSNLECKRVGRTLCCVSPPRDADAFPNNLHQKIQGSAPNLFFRSGAHHLQAWKHCSSSSCMTTCLKSPSSKSGTNPRHPSSEFSARWRVTKRRRSRCSSVSGKPKQQS